MNMCHGTLCFILSLYLSHAMPSVAPIADSQEVTLSHSKFARGASGKTVKSGGIKVSFSKFTSEDGNSVERFVGDHKTAQAARAALQEECHNSSRISQGGYRSDAHGKRIGRRVELVFTRAANASEYFEVAWTNGPLLYILRSESRKHLLDFEQQVYSATSIETLPK